jgi:hypothetical protein
MASSVPKGPSIDTVAWVETVLRRPLFTVCGSVTMKLTSGGIDSGAFPMCDSLRQVAENFRVETFWNAGSRKLGIENEVEDTIALSKPRTLFVDNMVRPDDDHSQFLILKAQDRSFRWKGISFTWSRSLAQIGHKLNRDPINLIYLDKASQSGLSYGLIMMFFQGDESRKWTKTLGKGRPCGHQYGKVNIFNREVSSLCPSSTGILQTTLAISIFVNYLGFSHLHLFTQSPSHFASLLRLNAFQWLTTSTLVGLGASTVQTQRFTLAL